MVCDVSFISLKKVIEPNLHLLKNESVIIALIKPQFESKKNETKKGVVKDFIIHQRICNEISEWFNNCLLYTSPSPRDRTRSRMPSSA